MKKMNVFKKQLLLTFSALAFIVSSSEAQSFKHPGILHTQEDFDRIKEKLAAKEAPYVAGYNKLTSGTYAQLTHTSAPTAMIVRGGTSGENYAAAMRDAAAAYQCGLRWRLSGDTKYADKAVEILNAWAHVCKGVGGDTNASLASGLYGYEFANAAELVRDYEGWKEADFVAFKRFMLDVFYPGNADFLRRRHGTCDSHYWSNWGLCNVLAMMSIGILCDDVFIYNQGITYYKKQSGYNECLNRLVWKLYEDERGPLGYLGQMQESNRDQGHSLMAAGLAADVCEIAWSQGEDLYSFDDNRLAAGLEYVACYNSGVDDVPNTLYASCDSGNQPTIGSGGRGGDRPIWARILGHYEGRRGITMKYSRIMSNKVGVEGGGGYYGSTSGGFDHLGFGTLMCTRDAITSDMAPTLISPVIFCNGTKNEVSEYSNLIPGDMLILSPQLPDGEEDTGNWKWENGSTSRELNLTAEKSGIYRVVYTNKEGIESTQYFSLAVKGDCTQDTFTPCITVGTQEYNDTVIVLMPRTEFNLSVKTPNSRYGTWKWSNGATTNNITVSNISSERTYSVTYLNQGGFESQLRFHIKLSYLSPALKANGGTLEKTNTALIKSGQSVELIPSVYKTGGTWLWSNGSEESSVLLENLQESQKVSVTYTYGEVDYTADYQINVYTLSKQMEVGKYYIRDASGGTYLTNDGGSVPVFSSRSDTDQNSQLWNITKDGDRYKILSAKDGKYINEKGVFGTNPYYTAWNTYSFHWIIGTKYYAIQNGGSAGTQYWKINGSIVNGAGDSSLTGFPFEILSSTDVGIDQQYLQKTTIFPNPVQDRLIVNVPELTQGSVNLILCSITGKIVKTFTCTSGYNEFDVNDLSSGIYIASLTSNTGKEVFKLIKK